MKKQGKTKRRGFVMTGGGAKGLYEAGVIHAFHNTGMEFDVITGSSIGAMNSIFFAEYLLRKKSLPTEVHNDPQKAIQQMENIIRCYLHTWLLMPSEGVIDDGDTSALGNLVKDLQKFNLNLSDLVTLGWWSTDPGRGKLPSPAAGTAFLRVIRALQKRLSIAQLLRLLKDHRDNLLREAIRTYLNRFGMDYSLIPSARDGKPGEDSKLENMFTRKVAPLQPANLTGDMTSPILDGGKEDRLVDPNRTFKDFRKKGIDVRLTRANFRTGRLEISSYLSMEDFLRFMEKHAWRLEVADPEKMPLGSFRLQLPGNPNVIKSALASGRFPGVFAPFHFKDIYPDQQKENQFLQEFLSDEDWMADSKIQDELRKAYFSAFGSLASEGKWQSLLARWRKPDAIRSFFPYTTDIYVDGGAIDNTPSNTAVDATREWIEAEGKSRRDFTLELFVIFLSPEPRIKQDVANDPLIHEVVQRTLAVQSAATATSDAVVVDTINTFGERGDKLARSLLSVLDALENSKNKLSPEQRKVMEASIREVAEEQGIVGYRGSGSEGILKRMKKWAEDILQNKLPLHVDEIKIYPDAMPLSTLQFTERLGYRQDNGIEMITMGCYNTLWALRAHIENLSESERDAQDELSLKLVRKMMGNFDWPKPDSDTEQGEIPARLEMLKNTWQCSRRECLFHAASCMHGARMEKAAGK